MANNKGEYLKYLADSGTSQGMTFMKVDTHIVQS